MKILLNLIITKLKKITNEVVNRTALANTVVILMQLEIMQLETNYTRIGKDCWINFFKI